MKRILERHKASLTALLVGLVMAITHLSGMPKSYDLGGHISRIYILIQDGLGWTDMWYNGHVLFGFYPPLYHFLMTPFALISFDLIRPVSFGLLGFLAFYSMYYYTSRKISENRAIASGLLFLTGWLLYIAHLSGSMPQAFAAALAPAFYAEIIDSLEGKNPAFAGFLGGLIILLHHNAAIAIATGAVVLIGFNWRKNVFNGLSVGFLAILTASIWLIPALTHYSDTTFSLLTDIGNRGLEDVVLLMPLFGSVIVLKLLGSLGSLKEHKQETYMAITGLLLSIGYFAPVIRYLPVFNHLPLYRFYVIAAFATAFLVSASSKKVLVTVLALSVAISGAALTYNDFSGFQQGQRQAYEYVADQDTDLVYDSEDGSLRAYALTIHGKDIADGWSIGSTPIRPGLMEFQQYNMDSDPETVEFLRRWSTDTVITYRNNELNSKLHYKLENSSAYTKDRCFEQTCIFRLQEPKNAVIQKQGSTYVVNASKELPIPYSSRFNGSTYKTEAGFIGLNAKGLKTISYKSGPISEIAAFISLFSLVGLVLIYRRDLKVPQSYSKRFRNKLGLCAE